MRKWLLAWVLTLALALPGLTALAAPEIESVEVKNNGRIEVEFHRDVRYKNATVSLKDAGGNSVPARITKKDDDELTFKPDALIEGMRYTFTLSGIRARGDSAYTSVTGSFVAPTISKPSIKSVEYEGRGRFEVDFYARVQYKRAKVTVVDESGKSYKARITEKDRDDMTVRVTGLKPGGRYAFTISGIRAYGVGRYGSITGTFNT